MGNTVNNYQIKKTTSTRDNGMNGKVAYDVTHFAPKKVAD